VVQLLQRVMAALRWCGAYLCAILIFIFISFSLSTQRCVVILYFFVIFAISEKYKVFPALNIFHMIPQMTIQEN